MKNLASSKKSRKTYSFGLGLSFIPLGLAAGMTNNKLWIGFVGGVFIAGIIEWIRYKKLNKTIRNQPSQ